MSSPSEALRTAACIAFRHIDEIGESEREHVLLALIEVLPEADAEVAQNTLFHLRQARAAQLQLKGILERRAPLSTALPAPR